MKTKSIKINDQDFILHPSGAMYWVNENMLLIADVHFGKVLHFRKHGSAVPYHVLFKNFEKLNVVISFFKPSMICFLGDLFHSYVNGEWQLFEEWVGIQNIPMTLVTGNHDIISPELYRALDIHCIDKLVVEKFLLTHHPEKRESVYNIAGHVHPGIQLRGLGHQRLKVSCFFQSKKQMILPAFGAFTGQHILRPIKGDNVFATVEDEVFLVNLK